MMNHEKLVNQKLADKQLRENLDKAMHTLQGNRNRLSTTKFKNFDELRNRAKTVKNNALATLDERLLEFEANATKNGMKVHWAVDGGEANEIIYQIIKSHNGDKVLKQKTMASEEIHLNHYLEDRGVKAMETDLGELIIQLIQDPPVHIVVPAIHKNRNEVGRIFQERLGAPLESEPEKLNAIARNHLRNAFRTMKIGISGANFGISKAGAIWLLENEGNGRMCTTAPDVHIIICGIEKVLETFEDVVSAHSPVTPSAVGAPITCYNNIITGPRKEGELDGPKEVHVVLLDNGRSDMLTNEEYYEALRCVRCGACMNYCPVYDKIGGHTYHAVYPGPIGEVISPQIFGMEKNADILNFCSLCGRCSEVCPVKIPLAETIRKLRSNKVGEGKKKAKGSDLLEHSKLEKMGFAGFRMVTTNGFMWRSGIKMGSIFSNFVVKHADSIPVVKLWTRHRTPPVLKGNLHADVQKIEGVIYE